jgi:hypothetical protein
MQGLMSAENVKLGMALRLPDGGSATVMWRHARTVTLPGRVGDAHPVMIARGAFGRNQPSRDLVVSAQQRILIGHKTQCPGIAAGPALVPAIALLGRPGIHVLQNTNRVTWVHLACRAHHVFHVHGCLTETALLEPAFLASLSAMDRLQLTALFASKGMPNPATAASLNGPPAYPCYSVGEGRRILAAVTHP